MPTIDMSLEELKKYNGCSPCPHDFDQYWDKALEEMRATDLNVELVPSDFQSPFADCFDLYFTGVRGARIHAKYLRPKNVKEPHPAILQFHGYSWHSGDWNDKLGYVANGFSVAALDCRGQGGYSEDVGGLKGTTFHGNIVRGLDDKPENLMFRHIAKRIKGKVLFATGLMDTICPPSSQFAVYNKITSKKSMVIYPDFGHEELPGFNDKTYSFMLNL